MRWIALAKEKKEKSDKKAKAEKKEKKTKKEQKAKAESTSKKKSNANLEKIRSTQISLLFRMSEMESSSQKTGTSLS